MAPLANRRACKKSMGKPAVWSSAISAGAAPIAGANLKPWPETPRQHVADVILAAEKDCKRTDPLFHLAHLKPVDSSP